MASMVEERVSVPESFRDLKEEEEGEEEDEEEDVCRICRNPGDADNPLRYPCACSGSIKYVHQECLLQWLNHSNARQCEVCKHAFSFSPVYADNAPSRLPFQEFLVGIAMKACHVLQFFLRLSFVLSVWLLIIPFITFWLWRLAFVRSLGEARKLFLSRISAALILTDCLHGFLLSASIVFIFLGATSLRDYFRHLRELGGQDADREDDADRQGARAVRRPGPGNRIQAGAGNVDDAPGGQGIAGAGQIIMRNAENVAAQLELQAARLEARVEQMFDGLDDADGAEDVPFDELVGMQGPVFHLVENAITVLASNAIFLGVVIFLPFSVGRLLVFYASRILSTTSGTLRSNFMPVMESALALANTTVNNPISYVANISEDGGGTILAGQLASSLNMTSLGDAAGSSSGLGTNIFKGMPTTFHLSDVATLAIGYMFIFCVVIFYLSLLALIRYCKGEPLAMGRLYGIASAAEAIPSIMRQFLAGMRHLITMVKVAFLLVIELGVFPLMCGWWLDICTIKMLGTTVAQRVEFFSVSPLASSLIHWAVGIVYMLQISIFVSLLRGVLRNGVLYFLRDPADPNYNPFRDLIDDPVHKHARRVLLSVAVYGSLIVMLVFLPVKLAMWMAPSIFPLDVGLSDPFTEIPADMLLFQICLPFAMEHFKPRITIKAVLRRWFTVVGWALGLTEFLLPKPEDNGGQENGNAGQARQERVGVVHRPGAELHERALVAQAAVRDTDRFIQGARNLHAAEGSDSDEQAGTEEYGFVVRIVLLLLLAWVTLLLFNSTLIVVPIYLGRVVFGAIPRLPITHGIKCNDIYAFNIGCHLLGASIAGIRYSLGYLRTQRMEFLVQVLKWCSVLLKSAALLSIWIFVIPVLIGLLFELLVIVPLRVPVDESPVFLLYQDWALGLVFLKIWTRLVMLDQMAPLVDESWRMKFERVRADGFSGLRGSWVFCEIVAPILLKLLTALCVPYVFARGVFPVLGYPLIVNSAVYRFAWLGCLLFSFLWFCVKRFHVWFTNLHNSIRDDRYLIGRRLHNFGEDVMQAKDTNVIREQRFGGTSIPGSGQQQQEEDAGLRFRPRRHEHLMA
ncbi:probable E3 ubiquitin ligase SUD1 [Nymphaea colorata]|nr:probable E3 ubiquitin ligase SUD1 [Nymphaea colorata]